ncbi:Uncharacterised protein [Streptococcus dysgalactiae subsp. equisimilis]|uniref:Uncharacterized protein n=1 Tax=Streptococcus dysgalactiae TaxID=1334 RepID=A0A9X9QNG4_STRDY|nr:Uncharacterised protein [Streptococcus dysgalactiae subsp. equisimilis]VTS42832.1 Uncharacterised protein [Streptococcus dysgalactiae subsp. equisimilis]VTS76249.1 Uncharacterised protein [Streptococcus dysgalactiae]
MTVKLSSDRLVLLTVYWRFENHGRYPVIGRLVYSMSIEYFKDIYTLLFSIQNNQKPIEINNLDRLFQELNLKN